MGRGRGQTGAINGEGFSLGSACRRELFESDISPPELSGMWVPSADPPAETAFHDEEPECEACGRALSWDETENEDGEGDEDIYTCLNRNCSQYDQWIALPHKD